MKFNGITRLITYPIYPTGVYVGWELGGEIDPGPYTFNIYRSGGPEGPWEKLNSVPLPGQPIYVDKHKNLLSKYRELYYFVEAFSGRGTKYTSPIKNLIRVADRKTYAMATEINRNEMLLLRQYAGVQVFVFKKKHFGDPCSCYEPITGTIGIKDCLACKGTRYVGGYWYGIRTWANITQDNKVFAETTEAYNEPSKAQAWLTAYPMVSPDDLLVEADTNRRWSVRGVSNTELRRYPVRQTLTLNELPHSDIEFKLNYEYGPEDLENALNEVPNHGRPKITSTLPKGVAVTPHLSGQQDLRREFK